MPEILSHWAQSENKAWSMRENPMPFWSQGPETRQSTSQDYELPWNRLQSQTRVEVLPLLEESKRAKITRIEWSDRAGQKYHVPLHIAGSVNWNWVNCTGHVLPGKLRPLQFLSHRGVLWDVSNRARAWALSPFFTTPSIQWWLLNHEY